MMRDMRDPEKLGKVYLRRRAKGTRIETAAKTKVPDYEDGGHISSNPADHHSKVDQTLQHQEPGDAR